MKLSMFGSEWMSQTSWCSGNKHKSCGYLRTKALVCFFSILELSIKFEQKWNKHFIRKTKTITLYDMIPLYKVMVSYRRKYAVLLGALPLKE